MSPLIQFMITLAVAMMLLSVAGAAFVRWLAYRCGETL
ncbi:hypothetical protein SAMN06295937_100797 [Sphingopyxis flava]|uniref:Uncharacterized protein n=1 Tax=Sphingopyxis flava TaxID=1507287 RepID=A0A1T5BSC7_9SPHN|nr:hypothetical protein SAMN06295937_100797 [Sphingopyxis flava]